MGLSRRVKRSGFLLIAVVAMTAVLFVFSLTVVNFHRSRSQLFRKAESTARAREAARAGMNQGLAALSREPDAAPAFGPSPILPEATASLVTLERTSEGLVRLQSTGVSGSSRIIEEALVSPTHTVFLNEFDRDASQWQQSFGIPVVVAGHYVLDVGLFDMLTTAGDPDWKNYTADFKALLSQGLGLGMLVRVKSDADGLDAYRADFVPDLLGGRFRLTRIENDMAAVVAERRLADTGLGLLFALNLWHDFRLTAADDRLTLKVDGSEVLTYQDPDPLPSGAIGVQPALGTIMLLDRVEVIAHQEVLARWRH
ncbi:MAG: hypothetical protein KC910_00215 [Candidatus Eremiobacteraeota bacterium]|nr:hypothetical protein [Candidatus Eremiobacteraeota bacterium]